MLAPPLRTLARSGHSHEFCGNRQRPRMLLRGYAQVPACGDAPGSIRREVLRQFFGSRSSRHPPALAMQNQPRSPLAHDRLGELSGLLGVAVPDATGSLRM